MNAFQFLRILKARWHLIALGALIGLVLGTIAAFRMHKTFRATAEVLVNVRAPDSVGETGQISEQLSPDYLATQADVIRSDRVAEQAVQMLGFASDPDAIRLYRQSQSPLPINQYYSNQLRGGLTLGSSPQSRVISIQYGSPNPMSAAQMATAIAEAYRDVSLDLQVEPARQSAAWYDRTSADLQNKLQTAQTKLAKRQAELGVAADVDQTDAEVARLSALSAQLAGVQAQKAAASSETSNGALPLTMANPVVAGIQGDLARLEAQRKQLATVAGPNNTDYTQLSNQIAELRRNLEQQEQLVSRAANTSSSNAASTERTLTGAVAEQKSRVMASRKSRGEIAALQQDVDNLKITYQQFAAKRSQANLLGNAGQTNVSILSPASVPTSESGPPRSFVALAGIIFGTVAGTILAFLLEFLDQRIRSSGDAEVWLGIPNLGGVRALNAPEPLMLSYMPRRLLPGRSEDAQ